MYSNKCAARRTSIGASRARVLGERREVQGCWTSWNQKVIALDLRAWFAECREQLAPQWIVLPHHANCKPALAGSTRALCIATIPTQRVKASSLRQSGWPPAILLPNAQGSIEEAITAASNSTGLGDVEGTRVTSAVTSAPSTATAKEMFSAAGGAAPYVSSGPALSHRPGSRPPKIRPEWCRNAESGRRPLILPF